MSKFVFQHIEDDGSTITSEFDVDVWLDAFPKFLALMNAAGFTVGHEVGIHVPGISEAIFKNDDRDFLIFDSDFAVCDCDANMDEDEPEQPSSGKTLEQWVAEGHSDCYYDGSRNK
jgi:hypothetical protein